MHSESPCFEQASIQSGIIWEMKPLPAPKVCGETEAARMDAAVRKMFSVSKEDFLKEEAKYQAVQAKKKRARSRPLKRPRADLSRHYNSSDWRVFCQVSYCPK